MTKRRTLKPERILKLFAEVRHESSRLGRLIRDTLAASQESRDRCRHLLPLFEGGTAEQLTYWQVYLAHNRWKGAQQWQAWTHEWTPHDLETAFRHLDDAPSPLLWGLVEALCETSRQWTRTDRKAAELLATKAIPLAQSAPVDVVDTQCRHELTALTYATLGNALRAQDQVTPAREAMELAEHHLSLAPARPLGLTAKILSLRATLESWERRYLDCLDTLEQALESNPSSELRARLLLQSANVQVTLGRPMDGLTQVEEATGLISRSDEPHLWACAEQYRFWILTELGRFEEAAEILPQIRQLAENLGTPIEKLRLRWAEARLALGQNHQRDAEIQYREVSKGFLELGLSYNAALVTLELARLLLQQGRLEEVKTHVVRTMAEFHRQQVEPELMNALALLEEAVLSQGLTLQVLKQALNLVERRVGR